jgi:predicted dehydrogenase
MTPDMNRRKFLQTTAAATTAFTIVPRHVLGGAGYIPPSEKITLAQIGFGTQGIREVGGLLADPSLQMVAVCDVEKDGVNYLEWGKNSVRATIRNLIGDPTWRAGKDWTPGGRDVGKEVIEAYYKKQGSNVTINTYADFREMLDKEKDLDAIKVIAPDHMHAIGAIMAMRKGKHVMSQKPMANRLSEGRLAIEVSRQMKVQTDCLGAGDSARLATIKSWIDQDAIGTLREIHYWCDRPVWPQYPERPTDKPAIPKDFNWELWQGPVPDRDYHPWYTHTSFRGWYDYGGGAIGDMAYHALWAAFQVFDLDAAHCVETSFTESVHIYDKNVSVKVVNEWSFPLATIARMQFKAKGSRAALDIVWYDGGLRPQVPDELRSEGKELASNGILFVGDKGKILAGFDLESPQIIPESKMEEFRKGKDIPVHLLL